jgi:hypothetical protein
MGEAEVAAFISRRSEWRRRVTAATVAAAVFALGSVLVWRGFQPTPPPPSPQAVLPDAWERCTNDAAGYSIGYPADWFTTDVLNGEEDPANACRWFDPEPFGRDGNIVSDGFAYPLEVGVRAGGFDVVVADETEGSVRVLSKDATSIGGLRAVRLELEFLDGPIVPAGTRLYEYVIELASDRTLRVYTADQPGIAGTYEDNRRTVDRAVATLRFADPAP